MNKIIIILLSTLCLLSCKKSNHEFSENYNFKNQLGKTISLKGKALDAKLGALLKGKSYSIWIDGLSRWPNGFYEGGDNGKMLIVTGTIIERYDLPVFIQNKGTTIKKSGIPQPVGTNLHQASHRFLLKNAQWKLLN